jgi:hypothetical protein
MKNIRWRAQQQPLLIVHGYLTADCMVEAVRWDKNDKKERNSRSFVINNVAPSNFHVPWPDVGLSHTFFPLITKENKAACHIITPLDVVTKRPNYSSGGRFCSACRVYLSPEEYRASDPLCPFNCGRLLRSRPRGANVDELLRIREIVRY